MQRDQFADRDLAAGAGVEGASDDGLGGRGAHRRGRPAAVSLTIQEVAGGPQIAEGDGPLPAGDLADDGRDHRPHRLARPEGVERPQGDHRSAEARVVAVGEPVAARLRSGVRRLGVDGVVLGDRHRLRRAVGLAGRGVHQSRDVQPTDRLEHVERAGDVGVHVASAVPGRSTGSRSARPGGRRPRCRRAAGRTEPGSRTSPSTTSTLSITSAAASLSQPYEENELYWAIARTRWPGGDQRLDQMRADEALRTGDGDGAWRG